MQAPALFVCEIKKAAEQQALEWDQFQVIREFVDGEDDVLAEGCYYACRSSIDRYYRYLNKQENRFQIYWASENRFEVYFLPCQNGNIHTPGF